MNAQDLRNWLQVAVGKSVNFQGVQSANWQGVVPASETPANGSYELISPLRLTAYRKVADLAMN
jgi:hypothetical protein